MTSLIAFKNNLNNDFLRRKKSYIKTNRYLSLKNKEKIQKIKFKEDLNYDIKTNDISGKIDIYVNNKITRDR